MGRTYAVTKKRGKLSKIKRLRDKRETAIKLCLSDEYVEENCHVAYYNNVANEFDDLPSLEIERVAASTTHAKQSGNRIVNIAYYTEQCKKLAFHDIKCTMGKMEYKSERRTGITSCFHYYCRSCEKTMKIYSHPSDTTTDTNKMIVWGANAIGIGYSQTEELFSAVNIPMMSSKYFRKIEKLVGENWEEVLQSQILEAGKEEKRQATEAGEIEDGVPFITVVVDGGWAKRSYGHGFNSLSGVAVIIGKRTGKLLFLGIRNKYCSACSMAKDKDNVKPHVCYKNYHGASTGMEQEIIIQGFNKSIEDHGVRYKFIIGDGDSSVYARIVERVTYGRSVLKLECANHVTRCYTSRLHKISLKTTYAIETRKILKSHIPRLCMVVRCAISNNSKAGASAVQLREDLKNGAYHVFGDHSHCRTEYCKRKEMNEINYVALLKQNEIFSEICSALDYVVCKADRLVTNATTNYAEHYMSLVSKFSGGKRINFCKGGSYYRRCIGAALSYNNGPSWHDSVVKTKKGTIFTSFCNRRRKQCEMRRAHRKKQSYRSGTTANGDMDYGPEAAKPDLEVDAFNKEKQRILLGLQKDVPERISIEMTTRGQHENLTWRIVRRNRLTASNFGKICKRLETTSCHCAVMDILYKSSKELHTPAIVYGRLNEKKAIELYEAKTQKQVTPCGIFISEEHFFLGASPDGLLEDGGCVEVKCLYSSRNQTIKDAIHSSKNLCVSYVDGNVILNKKHNYFYQVQGQLHVVNRSYCDFILYTDDDLQVIRIEKDTPFWLNNMLPKLKEFFYECMLPELADPRVPRGMRIRDSQKIIEAQERKQAQKAGR